MPISITWGTRVIYVPQNYLTPPETGEVAYTMDLEQFRLDLKGLEDSEEGMCFPDTHVHATEVTLSGVTYNRFIAIANGFTVEFEDGQYVVAPYGANSNLADVKTVNQVSLVVLNSAGLQTVESAVSGLTPTESAMLSEIWKIMGLDATEVPSLEVTPTTQEVGDGSAISMTITKVGDTVTVQRST
jgi:hypothetical protein